MDKQKKKIIYLILLIIVMIVTYSYRFFYRSIDAQQYQAVKIGMTKAEVKDLLGEPVKISYYICQTHGPSEIWRYNIKYSILSACIWFKLAPDKKLRVAKKTWGFE
jgi:outer membrane protein assembly factor BamE (lipoprotein component of BamABCDE complex)